MQVDLRKVGIHDERNIKNLREVDRPSIYTPDPTRGSADLILSNYRSRRALSIPLKIIDLQNDFIILVTKQWKIIISVPMSYISL